MEHPRPPAERGGIGGDQVRRIIQTLSLLLFGFSCGALGQFGYYADFMGNPVVLFLTLIAGAVIFLFTSDDLWGW